MLFLAYATKGVIISPDESDSELCTNDISREWRFRPLVYKCFCQSLVAKWNIKKMLEVQQACKPRSYASFETLTQWELLA